MKGNETLRSADRRIIGLTPEPMSWQRNAGLSRLRETHGPQKTLLRSPEQESMICGQMTVDLGIFQSCTYSSPDKSQPGTGLYDLRIQSTVYINKSEVVRRLAENKGIPLTPNEVETIARELGGGDRWLANRDVATTGNPMEIVQKDGLIILDWIPDKPLSLQPQEIMDAIQPSVYPKDYQPLAVTPLPLPTATPQIEVAGATAGIDVVPSPIPQGTGLIAVPSQTPESAITPLVDPKLLYGVPLGLFVTLLGTLAAKQLWEIVKDNAHRLFTRSSRPLVAKPLLEPVRSKKIEKPKSKGLIDSLTGSTIDNPRKRDGHGGQDPDDPRGLIQGRVLDHTARLIYDNPDEFPTGRGGRIPRSTAIKAIQRIEESPELARALLEDVERIKKEQR